MVSLAKQASHGFAWGQIGRLVDSLMAVALAVVVTRSLGGNEFGRYAVASSLVTTATLVSSLGVNDVLSRFVPVHAAQNAPAQVAGLFWSTLAARLAAQVVLGLLLLLLAQQVAAIEHEPGIIAWMPLLFALLLAQGINETLANVCLAMVRVDWWLSARVIGQIVTLVTVVALFFTSGRTAPNVLAASLVAAIVSSLVYLWITRRDLWPGRIQTPPLRDAARFGAALWATNLVTYGLGSSVDVLIMKALLPGTTGNVLVAAYNLATIIFSRVHGLLLGWGTALNAIMARSEAAGGRTGLAYTFQLVYQISSFSLVPAFCLAIARAPQIFQFIWPGDYAAAPTVFIIYAVLNIASAGVGLPVATALDNVAGRQSLLLRIRMGMGAANVALDFLLIPLMGPNGAAIATAGCIFITAFWELLVARRCAPIHVPVAFFAKVLGVCGLGAVLAALIPMWATTGISGFLNLALSGLVYLVVVIPGFKFVHILGSREKEYIRTLLPWAWPIARLF